MFTGIIEQLGTVEGVDHGADSAVLRIRGTRVVEGTATGDSISVNGVCLTVTDVAGDVFGADVMAETLHRSTLGGLAAGSPVNLERAMSAGGRFGGHVVQGHVDGTGTITSRTPGDAWEVGRIEVRPELARYLLYKGSVTVDGVSLTFVDAKPDAFTLSLIPTTLTETTLGRLPVGAPVNIEVDILGKYVASYLDRVGTGHGSSEGEQR